MIPRLLAITPGDGRALEPWIEALAGQRLPALLVREPNASQAQLEGLVRFAIARVPRVVLHAGNPHAVSLARALGLGVHVPEHAPLPHGLVASASVHAAATIDRRLSEGATFVLWSPVFAPRSKPEDHRPPIGADAFLRVARQRPVLALGGIDATRHHALLAGGASGTAVLGGLFDAGTPEEAAARLGVFLRAG